MGGGEVMKTSDELCDYVRLAEKYIRICHFKLVIHPYCFQRRFDPFPLRRRPRLGSDIKDRHIMDNIMVTYMHSHVTCTCVHVAHDMSIRCT